MNCVNGSNTFVPPITNSESLGGNRSKYVGILSAYL